jgi:hypothetical protein
MRTISIIGWIADAMVHLAGLRSTVTRVAQDAGYRCQTVYIYARKVKAAVEAECAGRGT